MRPRRLSEAGRAEIESVAVKRMEIPTDKELGERHGISRTWVQRLMWEAKKKLKAKTLVTVDVVPRGTDDEFVDTSALSDEPAP